MSNETIEKKSDEILQGISDKTRRAAIKKALGQYQRLQMDKAGVKIPKIRPKETEVSFTKRVTDKIKDFIKNTTFNPVRENLKQYKRKTMNKAKVKTPSKSETKLIGMSKYKGGMIKKKPVVKVVKKKK